jgi:uncharacterized protein YlxW (UPF0749 family)
MKKISYWLVAVSLAAFLVMVSGAGSLASGQAENTPPAVKVAPEQQKQLDQLKQLEEQLQKDREAMHSAITQYGWDSEQTDAPQEQLGRDRAEYRKLRRSLRSAGVPVPPPTGMGEGPGANRSMSGRMMRQGRGGHHCAGCDCPCCKG